MRLARERSCAPHRANARTRGTGLLVAGLVALALGGCGGTGDPTTDPATAPAGGCQQPQVTGVGDAGPYPATLDEMVAASDVVIEGHVIGDAGPAMETTTGPGGNAVQPMRVAVRRSYSGEPGDDIVVRRLETRYGITGTDERHAGAWAHEPWYCPGETYVLFLDRQDDGSYLALSRVGAVLIDPRPGVGPDGRPVATTSAQPPLPGLLAMSPDELRRAVEAAVAGRPPGSAPVPTPTPCDALHRLLESPDGSGGSAAFADAVAGARAARPAAPPEIATDLDTLLETAEAQVDGRTDVSNAFFDAQGRLRAWLGASCP